MNGIINGSSLFNNTGIFPAQKKTTQTYEKNKKTEFKKELDSVDISGVSREIPQAGYSKPIMKVTSKPEEESPYKAIGEDGIQEGVKLSDKAKQLLKDLQDKYGDNMDIYVANWNSDAEQDYYSGLSNKRFNALINPELLEDMANDESVREKYESVLANAGEASDTLAKELGEDVVKNIKSFSVTMDADGNVSYVVQLLKDFTEKNTKTNKELQDELKEKREEKAEKEKEYEKIEASSLEELIEQIKEKYNIVSKEEMVARESEEANE